MFGDRAAAAASDKNPRVAYLQMKERAAKEGLAMPRIYMACGTEDSLLWANRSLRDFITENGADVTYEEGPGEHNWAFWNAQLYKIMKWLPL